MAFSAQLGSYASTEATSTATTAITVEVFGSPSITRPRDHPQRPVAGVHLLAWRARETWTHGRIHYIWSLFSCPCSAFLLLFLVAYRPVFRRLSHFACLACPDCLPCDNGLSVRPLSSCPLALRLRAPDTPVTATRPHPHASSLHPLFHVFPLPCPPHLLDPPRLPPLQNSHVGVGFYRASPGSRVCPVTNAPPTTTLAILATLHRQVKLSKAVQSTLSRVRPSPHRGCRNAHHQPCPTGSL